MYNFVPKDYYEGNNLAPETARLQVIRNLTGLASLRLKELLETKHLYQKVSIDPGSIVSESGRRVVSLMNYRAQFHEWAKNELPSVQLALALQEPAKTSQAISTLILKNVKLACKACDGREAFTPVLQASSEKALADALQLFTLTYVCQSCQRTAAAFLVRRNGWDLELHGRSPIEELEIPRYIPKPEYSLFRDSVIAFNSGKVLAALFYLRSFIEQFARRLTGKTGRVTGEEVMKAYSETLHANVRDMMPSLREWYDKLSVPIHAAKDDSETYEAAKQAVEKHFEIRKVHDIREPVREDPKPAPGASSPPPSP
jgi:hypothetical protein